MKILAFTSIRADYDLLSPLYLLLHNDKDIDLKLLVSGAHLSKDFGYTKEHIYKDGFDVLIELETLINSDSNASRVKTASILLQNSIDIIVQYSPDVIIYAGDREDTIIASLVSLYLNIPTIHFYGGDHEIDGHQDTAIRHATSKLSSLHFVSSSIHKNRLIAMGEKPDTIFNIGSISLDKFKSKSNKISKINTLFNVPIPNKYALVIYHPIKDENAKQVFTNILLSLEKKSIFAIVSYPNSDPGYLEINGIIDEHKNNKNFIFYKNLDRNLFLSIFAHASFLIGNSSAGIYEAATVKVPAINVGLRQKDRLASKNVLFSNPSVEAINNSIQEATSKEFLKQVAVTNNIYGEGNSAPKAHKHIKKLAIASYIPKIFDPLKEN